MHKILLTYWSILVFSFDDMKKRASMSTILQSCYILLESFCQIIYGGYHSTGKVTLKVLSVYYHLKEQLYHL